MLHSGAHMGQGMSAGRCPTARCAKPSSSIARATMSTSPSPSCSSRLHFCPWGKEARGVRGEVTKHQSCELRLCGLLTAIMPSSGNLLAVRNIYLASHLMILFPKEPLDASRV